MGGGVERTWARCGRAIVASAVIWGIVGQSARAASAGPRASQIADQYVDVFVAKERLTAKIGFMQRETERLRAGNLMASSEVASLDNRSKGVVNELLVANVSLLEESLEHAAAQQDQDRKE